ncbi:MAG TPA: sortase [Patescibacteria group bacterium]|nr:sortase [Patescibacteria group bacterium]
MAASRKPVRAKKTSASAGNKKRATSNPAAPKSTAKTKRPAAKRGAGTKAAQAKLSKAAKKPIKKTPKASKQATKPVRPHKLTVPLALISFGLVIIGAGVIDYLSQPVAPPVVKAVAHAAAKAVHVQGAPSAVKPSATAVANYTVAPDLPKYVSIPSIGVATARVIQLGLSGNGQIATPDNIYDTGWYNGSAKPGKQGAMFIYGHVSSWQANGVFYNLKKLRPGDYVTITRGDNTTYTYQVVTSKTYPYNNVDMDEVLSPIDASTPGLNLMTCTGQVMAGTSEFSERLVVFTKLVS